MRRSIARAWPIAAAVTLFVSIVGIAPPVVAQQDETAREAAVTDGAAVEDVGQRADDQTDASQGETDVGVAAPEAADHPGGQASRPGEKDKGESSFSPQLVHDVLIIVAAIGLLVVLLMFFSAVRDDPVRFQTHWGGIGGQVGGWSISRSLSLLLVVFGLMSVLVILLLTGTNF